MLSECDRPPFNDLRARVHVKATVITAAGERVRLDGVSGRPVMEELIDRTYPDARMVSVMVMRKVQPC